MYLKDVLFPVVPRVTIVPVERVIILPQKEERKQSQPSRKDDSRQRFEDSLRAELTKTSERMDSLMRACLERKEAAFEDTVQYADSLGSFYVRERHTIVYDGALSEFEKRTEYLDVKLMTQNRIERVPVRPSPLELLTDSLTSPYGILLILAIVAAFVW
jgi:hypothetical protein